MRSTVRRSGRALPSRHAQNLRRAVPQDANAARVEPGGEDRVELRVVDEEGCARLALSRRTSHRCVGDANRARAGRHVGHAERR